MNEPLFSPRLLPAARSLALRTGAPVHLVRVDAAGPAVEVPFLPGLRVHGSRGNRRIREIAEHYLADLASHVASGLGPGRVRAEVLNGRLAESLAFHIRSRGAGIVLLGVPAHATAPQTVRARVAEQVMRAGGVPAFLVTPAGARSDAAEGRHVLVLLDGASAAPAALLDQVLALGGERARYTLLRPLPGASSAAEPAEATSGAAREDVEPAAWLEERGGRVSEEAAAAWTVDAVLQRARAAGAEIVVMARRSGAPGTATSDGSTAAWRTPVAAGAP